MVASGVEVGRCRRRERDATHGEKETRIMASSEQRFHGESLPFVEALYARFREDPETVGEEWRRYFEALEDEGGGNGAAVALGPSFRPSSIFNPPSAALGVGGVGAPASPPAYRPVAAAEAVDPEDRLRFLSGVPLFAEAPQDVIEEIAQDAQEVQLEDGEYLFHQGEVGNDLFAVLEGSMVILRDDTVVAEIPVGKVVGELAVLDAAPRVANAIARGATRLLRIRGKDLLARLEQRPALARGVIRGLTGRIRERGSKQHRVDMLIRSYRVRGHLLADLNPLGKPDRRVRELELEHYGLGEEDLDKLFSSATIPGTTYLTLRGIVERMREVYCGAVAAQYMHIDEAEPKLWLTERLEDPRHHRQFQRDEQLWMLGKLIDAEILEQFIHKKFLGAKRFSLEGAETLIPLLHQAINTAAAQGVIEAVIGMPHRGRLNVLANLMGKSPRQIFREFQDADAGRRVGRGDVKYHLGYSTDHTTPEGREIHLSLCFNPSHLEFIGPVVLGRVRAKQERFGDQERARGLGIIIHGDAAIAGEGVVQEMLNMSGLPGYETGGSLHIVVNNQIGFTTPPESARSTHYATDVAKMLQAPIFHVNGEHPEAVARALDIAMDYRKRFKSDVFIDMYCYRRYGHNEGDEPGFTQPLLYEQIKRRKSVQEGYLESLLNLGEITRQEAEEIAAQRRRHLEEELKEARGAEPPPEGPIQTGQGLWSKYQGGPDARVPPAQTAVAREVLVDLLRRTTEVPEGFTVHSKLERLLFQARRDMADGEKALDWSAGEALAYATLVVEGAPVRLTGQDSGRGTFSHRHAVLHDAETGEIFVPLNHLRSEQARFEVYDSPLSETAPLGFELGYSQDTPEGLILWEAQFGDFANVAQVIVDQFLSSTEDKWARLSGLVMLLPHGYEGQGPEHSSARLERYLNLCAEDNMQVVNLTTPAQIFHCLRRQVLRPLRKPLIVMSPKSLLRHPEAVSTLEDLAEGRFQRLIPDPAAPDPAKVERIVLCSGKVYYDLAAARRERELSNVALLRLEQLYPLADETLEEALAPYPEGTQVYWVQEEPWNMGAWWYLRMALGESILDRWPLCGVSRMASASPATGSGTAHKKEQEDLIDRAFDGLSKGK
jgi:2-oxoglutarate dehydrogenase E1 component